MYDEHGMEMQALEYIICRLALSLVPLNKMRYEGYTVRVEVYAASHIPVAL